MLILLFKRTAALLPNRGHNSGGDDGGNGATQGVPFPLTQQHIADSLGLSLVHTNKTLRKLERRGLHRIEGGELFLRDAHALARLADLYGDGKPSPRPLI